MDMGRDLVVMVDAGRSIENHIVADQAPRVDDGVGQHHGASTQADASADDRARVYDRHEHSACCGQVLENLLPARVIADGNDEGIYLAFRPGRDRGQDPVPENLRAQAVWIIVQKTREFDLPDSQQGIGDDFRMASRAGDPDPHATARAGDIDAQNAAHSVRSPPPCGKGWGVGVVR
jgi:hypothetical protein